MMAFSKQENNPKWRGGKIKTECIICKSIFEVPQSIIKAGQGKFCSRKCKEKYQTIFLSGLNSQGWKRIFNKCESCGKEYYVKKNLFEKGTGRFCSQVCLQNWRVNKFKGEKHPLWNRNPKNCIECGEVYFLPDSKYKPSKFCSIKCKGQWQSENLILENACNWQGGKSFEPYTTDWTDDLRESIRKRDEYICQMCGVHQEELNRKLDVHHINYIKEDCNPDNLKTLCNNCHRKTNHHREYWINYFTEMPNKE